MALRRTTGRANFCRMERPIVAASLAAASRKIARWMAGQWPAAARQGCASSGTNGCATCCATRSSVQATMRTSRAMGARRCARPCVALGAALCGCRREIFRGGGGGGGEAPAMS
ncbi:hypothetical protein F511_47307 [Dorcoceras hygrometricum]|uniref:Uncharacterized protein n=1 Tax=Dorcoceras hygrometricum TaxID=472368 RepID=A0A2Z6ZXP7_9LAMI|nr:hypothetical protein F511_47307 [Dorcoceras hygrometricum]